MLSPEQQNGAIALELLRVVIHQDTERDPKSALKHCQDVISASGVFSCDPSSVIQSDNAVKSL